MRVRVSHAAQQGELRLNITGKSDPYIAWAYYLAPGQGVLLDLEA